MKRINLVSVIMPAYNCADYIEEAVNSVLFQTYPNIEIIVINDGSTDDTLSILEKYAHKITIINQPQSGVASARNAGIRVANGEYIAFIDADDYWFKDKIQLQLSYLMKNINIGAVYNAWKTWPPENGKFPHALSLTPQFVNDVIDQDKSGWLYCKLLFDCIIHTSSLLVKKSILDEAGYFDENLRIGEDYDLWLRLSRITKIDKLSTVLSLYRVNPDSITNKQPLDINYRLLVLERAIERWGYINLDGSSVSPKKAKMQLSEICSSFAFQHYQCGNLCIAGNAIVRGLQYNPLSYIAIKSAILILIGITLKGFRKLVMHNEEGF